MTYNVFSGTLNLTLLSSDLDDSHDLDRYGLGACGPSVPPLATPLITTRLPVSRRRTTREQDTHTHALLLSH